jgi:hypothetical protein
MGRQLTALRQLRGEFTEAAGQTAQALAGIKKQLLALAAKVELRDYDRQDLRSQLRRWFDFSARRPGADQAVHIIPGFVTAAERAASEILPILCEALLRATGFDPVFREHRGQASVFYYLACPQPNGQPPGGVLRICSPPPPATAFQWMTRLTELNEDRVVNLADWAGSQLS